MSEQELRARAEAWLAEDPDPDTRDQLTKAIAAGELADLFGPRLEFGTAGLRGLLGPGPNRMNRALVRRVTAGFATYLKDRVPEASRRGVVVGFDGRVLSTEFAEDVVAVLAGAGLKVFQTQGVAPTPLVAFAVRHLRAAGGVMVTASHNPPEYNGYKVYWENGAQIVPPHDHGISAAIDAVGALSNVTLASLDDPLIRPLGDDVEAAYLDALTGQLRHPEVPRDVTVVYTAMHGVGWDLVEKSLRRSGVERLHAVPEQRDPDGAFPTVRFPNPEEDGAMDLAFALAQREGADVVLANDPDADRLAVALPRDNGFEPLSGNEIGSLLAYYLLTEPGAPRKPIVLTTVVSSRLLSRMAAAFDVAYADTLTGFKWIMEVSFRRADAEGTEFLLGYEEALGYSIGDVTPDKDGVGAALVFTELVAVLKSRGRTVWDLLEEIHRKFGVHATRLHTLTITGADADTRREAIMDGLRARPPREVGGYLVERVVDHLPGVGDLPPSNLLALDLEGGSRILARPSGTEPKVKFYFEAVVEMKADETHAQAVARAEARLDELERSFTARVDA